MTPSFTLALAAVLLAHGACRECGAPIEQRGTLRRSCSNRCKDRYLRRRKKIARPMLPPRPCLGCGEPLAAKAHTGGCERLYCSSVCRGRVRRARARVPLRTTCEHCHKPLPAGSITSKRFCGRVCNSRWRRERDKQLAAMPDLSKYAADEAAAIMAALRAGKVTRIEAGAWPDAGRPEIRRWNAAPVFQTTLELGQGHVPVVDVIEDSRDLHTSRTLPVSNSCIMPSLI